MSDKYTPRFSFEITEEQKQRADQLLSTYGLRRSIMGIILDDLLDMIESKGMIVVGAILSRTVKPRKIIPAMVDAEEQVKGE